ncbi:MAG: hypothetical protein ABH828_02770 [archaeon]
MIIIIVMILIILALVFFAKIKESDIQEKKGEIEELDLVKLSQVAYSLPEIQCSAVEVTDYGCIDLLKFVYLSEIITKNYEESVNKKIYFYYRELFKTSRIGLEIIKNDGEVFSWELYASDKEYNSKTPLYMPVVVFNATNDQNYFGILMVEKYG